MKILKFVLIFLGFLILGVIVALLLSPKEVNYENSVEVSVSPKIAWKAFTNEEAMKLWIPNLKSIEHKSGDPMTLGAVSELTFEENGQELTLLETVTGVEPGKSYAFQLVADKLMEINTDVRLEAVESGTRIQSSSKVTPLTWILRLTLFGADETMRDRSQEGYDKLADIINASSSFGKDGGP